MPIKKLNKDGGPGKAFDRKAEQARKRLHKIAQYAGESGLKYARENGTYIDQTGNLRSSLGYTVVEDKKVMRDEGAEKVFDGNEGVEVGKAFRTELAKKYGKGITLLMAAGMDYAAAVESRGKDVLSGSEMVTKKMVPRLLRKSGFKVS